MGQSESRAGAQRCWPHGLGGCSGTKDGTGVGREPSTPGRLPQAPTAETGCSEPTLHAGSLRCPQGQAICPETEEGFVLTPRASPLLTVPSPPAHRVPDTEICTEKAAYPSGS